jgi:hypothetical protein
MDKFILSDKKKPGKVIILTSPGSFSVVRWRVYQFRHKRFFRCFVTSL